MLGAATFCRLQRHQHAGLVDGPVDAAVGEHALADTQHHVLGNERRGPRREKIIRVGHLEAAKLQHVGEVLGRE